MRKLSRAVIKEWAATIDQDGDAFLDFAEGLHISEFCTQDGERVVYVEDGMYYLGRGFRMGEKDGEEEKAIIQKLEEFGIEFKKDY